MRPNVLPKNEHSKLTAEKFKDAKPNSPTPHERLKPILKIALFGRIDQCEKLSTAAKNCSVSTISIEYWKLSKYYN